MLIADRLAAYATNLRYDHLDEQTIHEVSRRLIDSLGCACGAYHADAVQIARRVAKRSRCEPGAMFLGGSAPTSPDLAAFVNGILFRYLDCNDTYLSLEPAHPSDNFAAVLATAETADCSGSDVITAAVLAYEIQCRLCDAASIRARGWDHVTYGGFSTAAASAKLLKLTPDQTVQALNLAGTPNVALRQTRAGELSEWKGCAFANASRNGVFAALLAAEGLTGPSPLFEGEMGFCRQVSGPIELPAFGGESGTPFMINRTSIKFWPAEYHSQSAIQAALELRSQIGAVDQILSLEIQSFDAAVDIIGKDPEKWRPQTRETADHSLPYCTAIALIDGDVTLESFSPQRLADPAVLGLMSRITVVRNAELSRRYPRGIPNRLVAVLADGRRVVAENEFPRGHDQNPMTDDEVVVKFRRLAAGVLSDAQQNRVLELCWDLPNLSSLTPLWQQFPVVGD